MLSEVVNNAVPDNETLETAFVPIIPTGNSLRILKYRNHTKKEDVVEEIIQ